MSSGRIHYIDNIRWILIISVVMVHAAVTYSGIGSWYYNEDQKTDLSTLILLGFFQSFMQAFYIGFLFLIAGYFSARSYDHKGAGRFLWDRFARLGVPSLAYMFFLNYLVLYALKIGGIWPNLPAYFEYTEGEIRSLNILGDTGPMWFAVALLAFSVVYALAKSAYPQIDRFKKDNPPGASSILAYVLIISLVSFLVRLLQPIGTSFYNMQLPYFTQYIALYALGIIVYRKEWLGKISYGYGMRWMRYSLIAGIPMWFIIMIYSGALDGRTPVFGGLNWAAAAYALWESVICAGMCLGLTVFFRKRYNIRTKAASFLSDNSFGVYVLHAPVLVAVTIALTPLDFHPFFKFLAASFIAVALCLLLSCLLRKTPAKKII